MAHVHDAINHRLKDVGITLQLSKVKVRLTQCDAMYSINPDLVKRMVEAQRVWPKKTKKIQQQRKLCMQITFVHPAGFGLRKLPSPPAR